MRIDYSEPKKSYVSAPATPARSRQDLPSSSTPWVLISVFLVLSFVIGFGSGWFLSQKAAKRSFQAAMEQKSLENTPPQPPAVKQQPNVPVSTPPPAVQAAQPGQADAMPAQPATANNAVPTPETQFSFYKNLPSGQKSTVLGSGVNNKDDGKAKQPLQAAIPANVQPPVQQAQSAEPTSRTALQPVATPEKNVAGGYAVQVASFPLRSEAEQSKNKLLAKGYGAYIVESNLGAKGTWYRVQIGKKMEQGAAKELANKVGKGALVITDRP